MNCCERRVRTTTVSYTCFFLLLENAPSRMPVNKCMSILCEDQSAKVQSIKYGRPSVTSSRPLFCTLRSTISIESHLIRLLMLKGLAFKRWQLVSKSFSRNWLTQALKAGQSTTHASQSCDVTCYRFDVRTVLVSLLLLLLLLLLFYNTLMKSCKIKLK